MLTWPDWEAWAIEIKRSVAPKPERGCHSACEDVTPARRLVVYPGHERLALGHGNEAVPLVARVAELGDKPPPR